MGIQSEGCLACTTAPGLHIPPPWFCFHPCCFELLNILHLLCFRSQKALPDVSFHSWFPVFFPKCLDTSFFFLLKSELICFFPLTTPLTSLSTATPESKFPFLQHSFCFAMRGLQAHWETLKGTNCEVAKSVNDLMGSEIKLPFRRLNEGE